MADMACLSLQRKHQKLSKNVIFWGCTSLLFCASYLCRSSHDKIFLVLHHLTQHYDTFLVQIPEAIYRRQIYTKDVLPCMFKTNKYAEIRSVIIGQPYFFMLHLVTKTSQSTSVKSLRGKLPHLFLLSLQICSAPVECSWYMTTFLLWTSCVIEPPVRQEHPINSTQTSRTAGEPRLRPWSDRKTTSFSAPCSRRCVCVGGIVAGSPYTQPCCHSNSMSAECILNELMSSRVNLSIRAKLMLRHDV